MDLGLRDKIAFIAASSDGLGKAVAIELAKEGAKVVINGRDAERLDAAQKEITAIAENEVIAVKGDLSISKDRDDILATVLKRYENLDILVTNVGGPPAGKFEELDQDAWDRAYEQLLKSAVALIHGFLPAMKGQPWARIIAITSQAVKQPVENLILSNAVRASIVGLVKTLASELGPYNITVNNVMPGYTQTSRLKQLIASNPSFADGVKEVPLRRFAQPEEFAAAVTFLASKRASYITGVSLAVDGGWIKSIM
jgi:3-oxoacyl-[acyl-carrier protein] reductase